MRSHLAGVDGVVRHRLQPLILRAEGDGVRLDAGIALGRHGGDQARIEATAEERGHRYVGHHVRGDRLFEDRTQIGGRTVRGRQGFLGGFPVASGPGRSVQPPLGPRSRRQLVDTLDRALFVWEKIKQRRGNQRGRINGELASDGGHQGLELGREHHPASAREDVHRLDAERIPHQRQSGGGLVVDRKGEHPAQPLQAGRAPGAPALQDDLGVGFGTESDASATEGVAELAVVVQLTVVAEVQAVLAERLISGGGQIDDREPSMGKLHRRFR